MASSTLVNDLSSSSVACSSRRVVETYKVKDGVTITEGMWVALDKAALGVEGAKTVLIATNAIANCIPVGVAATGGVGADGATTIEVVIAGYYPTAKVASGVVAGAPIMSAAGGSAIAFLGTGLTSRVQACGYVTKLVPGTNIGEVIITCSPI